jgi:hypothetical protein
MCDSCTGTSGAGLSTNMTDTINGGCPDICNSSCNGYSSPATIDPTYQGYNVEVAILQQDMNEIKEENAHIVELSPVYLSYASFQAMFYKSGNKFSPLYNLTTNNYYEFLANEYRKIIINPTYQSGYDISFNLRDTIIKYYEEDLAIPYQCWDICSFIEFNKLLSPIKLLTDVGNSCNIKCSITLDQYFDNLEAQGLKIDNISGLPLDPSGNYTSIYTGLVSAIITANFKSTTPNVRDIKIRWPFMINFASLVCNNESPTENTWPLYYWVEDENYDKEIKTCRSPQLKYDTVALNGSGYLVPRKQSGLSLYNRYSAYLYSKIK